MLSSNSLIFLCDVPISENVSLSSLWSPKWCLLMSSFPPTVNYISYDPEIMQKHVVLCDVQMLSHVSLCSLFCTCTLSRTGRCWLQRNLIVLCHWGKFMTWNVNKKCVKLTYKLWLTLYCNCQFPSWTKAL